MADAILEDVERRAHIKLLIKAIKAVLKQEAPTTLALTAQASVDLVERGWLFAVMIRQEGWPQGMDSHIELGKQLLSAIAAEAGGVRSTRLTLCAHDPFEASKALIQPTEATEQGPSCTIGAPIQYLEMGQGFLMVEGCVRTEDPHLTAQHIMSGIQEALGNLLANTGRHQEPLTLAGQAPPMDLASIIHDGHRVLPVRVPQLWEDLVKFVHGKEVSFSIKEGARVQAHLPASEQDTPFFPFTPENRAQRQGGLTPA
ncbi:hypothetical protein WJX74_004704 [Apatococcus lobatus]|uniref:GAF domain-containing protein n=1 Tax=Apatococcus lobatus TaxID=904363 RepID=A0AAW1RKP7_9CHLO